MLLDFWKSIAFWEVSRFRPFVLLARATFRCIDHWWNDNDTGKTKYLEKNLSRATWLTTNLTWTDLESNTDIRCERLATKRPNHATVHLKA